MAVEHPTSNAIEGTSIASVAATDLLSKRRPVWMLAFSLFCVGLFLVAPSLYAATVVVFGLSLAYVLAADIWPDQLGAGSKIYPIAGALLAASLLWIAVLAGSEATTVLGFAGNYFALAIASICSLFFFAALIACEFALAIALQHYISENCDAPLTVAIVINSKYAGLFRGA